MITKRIVVWVPVSFFILKLYRLIVTRNATAFNHEMASYKIDILGEENNVLQLKGSLVVCADLGQSLKRQQVRVATLGQHALAHAVRILCRMYLLSRCIRFPSHQRLAQSAHFLTAFVLVEFGSSHANKNNRERGFHFVFFS